MLFVHREGRYVDCTGLSFRRFMAEGFGDYHATVGDYALHLSTLFPDVRLKKFLEIRGADMGDRSQVLSLPALFKGLFYDAQSLDTLDELFDGVSPTASREAALSAARDGLHGSLNSERLETWGATVIEVARQGLRRLEPSALPYLDNLLSDAQQRHDRAQQRRLSTEELLLVSSLL